ncbi:MAG: inositol monophosphatase [Pseudonocardiales bacterium]|nr:inositol monophosphatase [Pseudonocardiales bacterium]
MTDSRNDAPTNPSIEEQGLALELEAVAVAVATDAARFVQENRRDFDVLASKSSATDLVTDVDKATESRIVAAIRVRRPADSILGEEGGVHPARDGSPADGGDAVQWVVDPIDGTVNFVLGLPAFSVSVAARRGGITLAGCVVDVSRREVFRARRGGGSWLSADGREDLRLTGPRPVSLAEAVVGTGFSYDSAVRSRQGSVVADIIGRLGNLRRLGSAAMDLCYVGAGRLDAYFEAGLNEWDRAAGVLVATEAGAVSGTLPGPVGEVTLAAGPAIFAKFRELLIGAGAERVMSG